MKKTLMALSLTAVVLTGTGCSLIPLPADTLPTLPPETQELTIDILEPDTAPTAETVGSLKPGDNTKPITPTLPPETTATEPLTPGWNTRDGKTLYVNEDGSFHTGWLELEGDRYYFLDDGTMAVGKVATHEDGVRYFTSTGKECVLVNPWNFVPEDYSVELGKHGDYKVAKACLEELKQMLADCKSDGHTAIVVSAYRSHEYQKGLHQRRIQRFLDQGYSQEDAEREAAKRVAVPGTSEHELGLALDIVDINYQNLNEKQETMPAQKWLMANSWRYGFILRYPNEKSEVTGIIYEPWHYRYVGKELAEELHGSGLCLEEYFAQLTTE